MTQVSRPPKAGWWRLLLAALAAVLVGLLGAATASAATVPNLETRVGASTPPAAYVVGVHESVSAGQRWGNAPTPAEIASATGVAANAGTKVGWNVGDDIYNVTKAGNSPAWSTVRSRFWKNEAANPQYGSWSDAQLARMSSGRAPQRYNPDKGGLESMDLSHEPIPFRDGGTSIIPRWPQDHAAIDPFRRPGY